MYTTSPLQLTRSIPKKRLNDFLTAVDTRIYVPITATARLFFLAYTATKMYLPPHQFPRLCDAAALGMEIGQKHRTRKAYVAIATIIGSAMDYIKKKQPLFSLLFDRCTVITEARRFCSLTYYSPTGPHHPLLESL
ncbi:hypothetical protein Aduo_012610 [Ancylostoma duodenale]